MKIHVLIAIVTIFTPMTLLSGCGGKPTGPITNTPSDLENYEAMQKADAEAAKANLKDGEV